MSENKTAPAAAKPEVKKNGNGLEAKVRILEDRVAQLTRFLERTFAFDVNLDGKIGLILLCLLPCLLFAASPVPTNTAWNITNGNGTNDLVRLELDGDLVIDGSLTADNLSTSAITVPGGTLGTLAVQTNMTVAGTITGGAARVGSLIVTGSVTEVGAATLNTLTLTNTFTIPATAGKVLVSTNIGVSRIVLFGTNYVKIANGIITATGLADALVDP